MEEGAQASGNTVVQLKATDKPSERSFLTGRILLDWSLVDKELLFSQGVWEERRTIGLPVAGSPKPPGIKPRNPPHLVVNQSVEHSTRSV